MGSLEGKNPNYLRLALERRILYGENRRLEKKCDSFREMNKESLYRTHSVQSQTG
jgi:hypothetical protein